MKTLITTIFALFVVVTLSCDDDIESTNPPVSEVKLDGVIVLDFPPGSFQSEDITISKTTDPNVDYIFEETSDLFKTGSKVPYQIKVNVGENLPQTDSINAKFYLPPDFTNSVPPHHGVELFALIFQDGGDETVELFDILPSSMNADGKSLSANLPKWIFTNERTADKTYEAIFMIGSTPGTNLSGRIGGLNDNDDGCQAGQILCPIGSTDLCTTKKTSGFSTRIDPVTGKPAVHFGLDFGIPVGTSVRAASDGTVEKVWTQKDSKGNVTGFGLYIIIRHENGSATLYAHLSNSKFIKGQQIKAGEIIALSGNSGKSTGPHLHFEYVPNGEIIKSKNRIDPYPCITSGNAKGSLTIRDNGTAADDAFAVYLENILVGKTEIGQSNSLALSNLRPGSKQLQLVCTVAPDDAGTYEIIFEDGITFIDGSSITSGVLSEGQVVQWTINIPKNKSGGRMGSGMSVSNAYIEK